MRIRLDSIGCRLNIGEIEAMARRLASAGHHIVSQGETADLCILNSCTVTAIASRKSRHFIRQLRRHNPGSRIAVTGCLAELEPEVIRALDVDLVVGNDDKDRLPEILTERGILTFETADESVEGTPTDGPHTHTRAFLKVQDGCDNRCTFCIVTIARGRGRSRDPADIVAEIHQLQNLGYQEVVLSGVHLGSYGHDLGRRRGLIELVRRILSDTDLARLRLSSIEPWDLDERFFEVFDNDRVLPHLHLPLQSGCDATLQRMARKVTLAEFEALVESARTAIADVSVSTDIMVGFPGETDDEFAESIAAVEALALSRLHIFRYSRREGTLAASMPEQVPGPVALERSRRMHELGDRLAADFHRHHLSRTLRALWENAESTGAGLRWSGLTDNYIRVLTETDDTVDLANTVTDVRLDHCVPGAMLGSIAGVSTSGIEAKSRRERASLPVVGGS
jgi:threonylcarbamoyladenosine tRNA methylthiotransferase MtaB